MQEKLTKTLSELVDIRSVSHDQEAVKKLLIYCKERLDSTGVFKVSKIIENKGVYSLYVSTTRAQKPKLLLQAHVDTVPSTDTGHKLLVQKDRLVGRGVFDMLFATAAYLNLIEELSQSLTDKSFAILLSGDEELGGFNGVGNFVGFGYRPSVVFLPDAGHGIGELNIGSKGVYGFNLTINGLAHHGSRPWEGDGAGNKLTKILHEILSLTSNTKSSAFTVVVTKLAAGDAINKGPATASAHLDVRYKNGEALASFKSKLAKILSEHSSEISDLNEAPAFNLDMKSDAAKKFMEVYRKFTPNEISLTKADGSSDARFFAEFNIPVIMLRPAGGGAHSDEEWLDTKEFLRFYELLKEYVLSAAL